MRETEILNKEANREKELFNKSNLKLLTKNNVDLKK